MIFDLYPLRSVEFSSFGGRIGLFVRGLHFRPRPPGTAAWVEIVPVEPQVFDLLSLPDRQSRSCRQQETTCSASVWDGRIVSESTLGTRMNAARAAIADSGEAQRLIRTLPRKGFRFVGDVREEYVLPRERWEAAPPAVVRRAPIAETPQHTGMSQRLNLHRAFSTARLPLIRVGGHRSCGSRSLAFFVWHSGGHLVVNSFLR